MATLRSFSHQACLLLAAAGTSWLGCQATPPPPSAGAVPKPPAERTPQRPEQANASDTRDQSRADASAASAPGNRAAAQQTKAHQQFERDGNDDPEPAGDGPFPKSGHFERVGRAPLSLRQICDLTPFGGALFAAHSLAPLAADGASISRYLPAHETRPFSTAFDWNRPGEPVKGGGAGQGFLRVRAVDGRLYVPDADPPYNGFGLMDWGTEGYVFVSRSDGTFAYATRPHFRPPARPTLDGRAGAMVVPRAYHDFDVIRFRGHLIVSTGAVPPKERAWVGPSPGALHVAAADLSHFEYALAYPDPYVGGVWRLTFMVRFRDRLYAGIEDYDSRSAHDFIMVSPAAGQTELRQQDVHPVRVTPHGAAQTLRWYADAGHLYWIAWGRDGTWLRVTTDGDRWSNIELPPDAGAPTDLVRYRGQLVVLAEHALLRLEGTQISLVASIADKKSPFELRDGLCAAPLAVFENELYAGGQRDGALYRFAADLRVVSETCKRELSGDTSQTEWGSRESQRCKAQQQVVSAELSRDTSQTEWGSRESQRCKAQQQVVSAELSGDTSQTEWGSRESQRCKAQQQVVSAELSRDTSQTEWGSRESQRCKAQRDVVSARTERGTSQTQWGSRESQRCKAQRDVVSARTEGGTSQTQWGELAYTTRFSRLRMTACQSTMGTSGMCVKYVTGTSAIRVKATSVCSEAACWYPSKRPMNSSEMIDRMTRRTSRRCPEKRPAWRTRADAELIPRRMAPTRARSTTANKQALPTSASGSSSQAIARNAGAKAPKRKVLVFISALPKTQVIRLPIEVLATRGACVK